MNLKTSTVFVLFDRNVESLKFDFLQIFLTRGEQKITEPQLVVRSNLI